ncbi:oxidized low-density lipoprotein receptor 1-like [Alligator sinensis]|uniref:Oxidized low-density lipoprotein receptor 1-like n=1 Tax=Alligator sinensis TaxID=38654 RepID=A0A3Q0FT14_ALLSI|nr:oxidized low-density lipoprotein receptor 1-like [Alligator sinensis]
MSCRDSKSGPPDALWGRILDKGKKCPALWLANQDRSYLFSSQKGTWEQCKSFCTPQFAGLLITESKEELDFITATSFQYSEDTASGAYYYPFWAGLSYNSRKRMWVWTDDSALSSGLFVLADLSPQNYPGGACAYFQGDKLKPGGCEESRFCVCERKKEAPGKK